MNPLLPLLHISWPQLYIHEAHSTCLLQIAETEEQIRLRLGAPDHRDYASPETLYFYYPDFSCRFLIRNGLIREICLILRPYKERYTRWRTESGLYEDDLIDKSQEEIIAFLKKHYPRERFLLHQEKIEFPRKGISFSIKNHMVQTICVFPARKNHP
ncbi:MAG: hypothetical protein NZM25_08310 [Leptospiraceae bacterium]|nr:hypothetical protein [Leptospiraceae bacterium]MDW8306720.1 hypothetical protein [Leptospiraceae bacterium]